MVLYKYLPPARLDVIEKRTIRFTQPADFNDPFEFRPCIQSAASDAQVREYVEANFETLVDRELAQYGQLVPAALRAQLPQLKANLPALFRLSEPHVLAKVSPLIDEFLNRHVGVLCLSELKDSILMWGHYTENHQGLTVGFDADHPFFSRRRSDQDEFGFLRRVEYSRERPNIVLSDTSSREWFQTKCLDWAYEKEWRIVRLLSEADQRVDGSRLPACLFGFPEDAVMEIVIGLRAPEWLVEKVRSLKPCFPRATLLQAREDPSNYGLRFEEIG